MTTFRKRFFNTSDPSQSIVVVDPQSAQVLSELLGKFDPGNWALQEETLIGSMPKQSEPPAKAPREAVPPAPASAPVASQAPAAPQSPVVSQAPAAPHSPVVSRPAVVSQSSALSKPDAPAMPGARPSQALPPPPPGVAPKAKAPEKDKGHERRKQTRFNMEFKVILVCEGKTFRTFSNNVSIGGMLLVHKIPPFMLNNNCRVVIARKDSLENIEFRCRVLGGADNPKRIEFIDCEPGALKSFEVWLAAPSSGGVNHKEAA